MDIEDVRLFTEVVSYASISEAARHNNMTQQTARRRVIGLERELGQTLLDRTSPIAPTAAGKLFLRYAYELLSVADEMEDSLRALSDMPKLVVRVRRYETDSFFHVLARLTESLGRSHPNVEFELVPDNRGDCELVRGGKLDIGFVRDIYGRGEGASYRPFSRFGEEFGRVDLKSNSFPFVFGVPEGHPVLHMEAPTLADIAAFRIAIPSFASRGAIPEATRALLARKGIQMRVDMVYSQTMLEYYAGAAPTSVCLFNERFSPESLASQHKHYVAVAPADDDYVISAAGLYLRSNANPALPCVLEELRAADDDSLKKALC